MAEALLEIAELILFSPSTRLEAGVLDKYLQLRWAKLRVAPTEAQLAAARAPALPSPRDGVEEEVEALQEQLRACRAQLAELRGEQAALERGLAALMWRGDGQMTPMQRALAALTHMDAEVRELREDVERVQLERDQLQRERQHEREVLAGRVAEVVQALSHAHRLRVELDKSLKDWPTDHHNKSAS